ncbi:MAG: hypothetical protein HYY78_11075 [Betaproteobacteria bacterium]|nr:hypothetical protein [Betaproteobacteria bacterium]
MNAARKTFILKLLKRHNIMSLAPLIPAAGRSPKVVNPLAAVSMESVNNSPEEFTAFIKAEIAKWARVVKASGAPVE